MNRLEIREALLNASETDYKEFNAKLLPGVANILGVRLPKLRELAKQAAKKEPELYLAEMERAVSEEADTLYYEEYLIFGLVIGYAKLTDERRTYWLDRFVPVINNWGVCDSCCMTYKWMKKDLSYWWKYIWKWYESDTEFGVRFALVCMLDHFVDDVYYKSVLEACGNMRQEGYYAKMAAAWAVSVCFVKYPEETFAFLETDTMDVFTHNKAIQKTCESFRVSPEMKSRIRLLKRK